MAGCLFVCGGPSRMGCVEALAGCPLAWAVCGALAGCPLSHGCAVPALPKGEPSLASPFGGGGLALARTERTSCQRPPHMGCVEALAGGPLSRLTATAPPQGEPSLASPFGGRWCPVGTVQRSVSAAASVGAGRLPLADSTRAGRREWTRVSEDGEGKVPASPPSPGKPPSRCATVREKRFAVSLASFPALRAHKVKGKVEAFLKKSFTKKLYARFARLLLLPQHMQCLHQLLLLHPAQLL